MCLFSAKKVNEAAMKENINCLKKVTSQVINFYNY